jgi:type IV pilus assembly protein PilB
MPNGQAVKKSIHTVDDVTRDMEEKAVQRKAKNNNLEYLSLCGFPMSPETVGIIPKAEAEKAKAIVFNEIKRVLQIGTTDPTSKEFQKLLGVLKEKKYAIRIFLISESSFQEGLQVYDRVRKADTREKFIRIEISDDELKGATAEIKDLQELETKISKIPITKVLDVIVAGAIQTSASDIHLEPEEKDLRLRYRIDGVLQDVAVLPKNSQQPITSRVKLLSKLKLNVIDIPQDGRFTITLGDKKIDVRVSILPSGYGETVVMRLLGIGATNLKLDDLGFAPRDYEKIKVEIAKPNGMILTTGPTGSGKTTTLYSFLNQIKTPEVKIITLENPIEYRLAGISQTQVEKDKGLDFASGLRAILRQDPDVVMVGEIRDLETAETALNAALTGHLVFSTLHTNDSSGVIPRLIDMGARPFVIAPAINAVIAQRLVRRLCANCREEYTPDEKERARVQQMFNIPGATMALPEYDKLYKVSAKGCDKCNGTGYKGRVGIYELFTIGKEMEKLIMSAATTAEIFEAAVASGMTTMAQDGILKAIEGITSIDEIDRVT